MEITYKSKFHGNAYLSHQSVESPRMNPCIKSILATAIAASAALTPANAGQLKITVDSARHVVIIPAVEGGADVAVAVIDRSIGVPDTTVTIASQLLMQNDLRGHVEDAAWYLRTPRREADPAADALMLTQGWTRYDMPAAIRGEINDSLPYPLEIGAQLDGVIRSKWRGKPLAGVMANVLAPRMADGASAVTDSLGRFHITGIEWADGTYFVIGAVNKKGYFEENIYPDFDSYPEVTALPQKQSYASAESEEEQSAEEYIARIKSSIQGMHVALQEVVVHGKSRHKGENIIERLSYMTVRPGEDDNIICYADAVANVPGINIVGNILMHHQVPVSIWVDGRYIGYYADEAKILRNLIRGNFTPPKRSGNVAISSQSGQISNTPSSFGGGLQYRGLGVYSANMAANALNGGSSASGKSPNDVYDVNNEENRISLADLEAMYPYLDNESVSYIPPHLAILFKPGIGNVMDKTGGILSINTKNSHKFRRKLPREFKLITPLGYQRHKKFYTPAYTPESVTEEPTGATLQWLPAVDLTQSVELPIPANISLSDIAVAVEGLTPQGSVISN